MRAIRNIVIGIADAGGDPHLAYAVTLAQALGAVLHVVHAYRLPDPALYPYAETPLIHPEALGEVQARVQSHLEEQVERTSGSVRITCRAVPLPAAMAILDRARDVDADLILTGATHHGAIARAILGTTAQRVLRGSEVPVLVNRGSGRAPRRVLLATDLSDLGARVQEHGAALATLLAGVEPVLRSLLVIDYDVPVMAPLEPSVLVEAGERRLAEFLARHGGDAAPVEARVRVGHPAREILAEAEEWRADLLVVGTHGRSGASRFLIGSVAESVVRDAPCDVLVIPAADGAELISDRT